MLKAASTFEEVCSHSTDNRIVLTRVSNILPLSDRHATSAKIASNSNKKTTQ